MVIEGMVVDVMETWPLQLTLAADKSRLHITLGMNTIVTQGGEDLEMAQIRPKQRIRVHGRRVGESGLVADSIVIVDEPQTSELCK